jgi:hypothetical protein
MELVNCVPLQSFIEKELTKIAIFVQIAPYLNQK